MKQRIIITNENAEIIHEEIREFARYSHAERTAIAICKNLGGKQWHIKDVKKNQNS